MVRAPAARQIPSPYPHLPILPVQGGQPDESRATRTQRGSHGWPTCCGLVQKARRTSSHSAARLLSTMTPFRNSMPPRRPIRPQADVEPRNPVMAWDQPGHAVLHRPLTGPGRTRTRSARTPASSNTRSAARADVLNPVHGGLLDGEG